MIIYPPYHGMILIATPDFVGLFWHGSCMYISILGYAYMPPVPWNDSNSNTPLWVCAKSLIYKQFNDLLESIAGQGVKICVSHRGSQEVWRV
jgi:hypothetical protein